MAKKKNPWTYRKRKKTKKAKNNVPESEAELAESSTLPDPDGAPVSMELSSDVSLNEAVKNEVDYPDIRFQSSTTLFPAKEIEDNHVPSEGPSEISKRTAEEEWLSNSSKKLKVNSDSTETVEPTIDDEVEEVAATPQKVKIEVIDLTEESRPIGPILCSPVKTSHLPNRLPGKPNAAQNVSVKLELSEKTSADAIGGTNINYHAIQTKSEPDNASENSSHVNTDKSYAVDSESVNIPLDNLSNIEVKLEKNTAKESENINVDQSSFVPPCNENNLSNESENNINVDQSSVVPPSNINIQIKTEQNKSNECQNEVDSENPQNKSNETETLHRAVLRNLDQMILELRSEPNNENRQITDQVPSSNTVSASIAKDASDAVTSFNYLPSAVPIKVEQNENCLVSGNSTSVSNLFAADISSVDRTVKNNQNKTVEQNENCLVSGNSTSVSNLFTSDISSVDRTVKNNQNKTFENCESSDNYLHVSRSPSVCSTEIPSDILRATEHLPNVINTQQTRRTSNDLAAQDSTNNEGQRIVVKEGNKSGIDKLNCISAVVQVRSEVESMDFQENSCSYSESQNYEDLSQKSANSNNENTGVVSTETLISDKLNRISISPDSDEEVFADSDSQRFKAGTFRTPLLKYLNCNKVDVLQVSRARSFLENLLKEKETSVIGSEVIPAFTDSQNKLKPNFAEKREESSNFQASEKESLNLNVDEILNKISWTNVQDVLNLNPNVTNLDSNSSSSQLKELDHEKRKNSSPNRFFESPSNIGECSQLSHSDSHSVYFDSPMDIESPLDNQSAVCLSSLDENKQVEPSKNQSMEGKKIDDELFSNEYLKKILGTVNSTGNSDNIVSNSSSPSLDPRKKILGTFNSTGNSDNTASTSSSPSLDPRNKSNITIDESLYQSLRQINLFKNNLVEDMNSVSNVGKKNSGSMKNSEIFPKNVALPSENVCKRSQDVVFNSSASCSNAVEVPPKRVKMSEDASKSKSHVVKRLSLDEYKKRDLQLASESPSDSSNRFSDFEQNMFTSNRQNRSLPITPDSYLQNPGYRPIVNTGYIQDPRLARISSRSLYKDVNSQQHLRPCNTSQTYPLQSVPEASSTHPPVKQKPSSPAFNTMRNSSNLSSASELFRPTVNTVKNQQVNRTVSELSSIHPSNVHPQTSEKDRWDFISPPPSESSSFSMSPNIYDHSAQGGTERQPLLLFPYFPDNVASVTHHHYSSRSREPILDPPLPASAPPLPPPLPTTPPIPSTSSRSQHHNSKRLSATKNASNRNQTSSEFSFVSLLSRQLTEGIGKVLISSNEIYLIIIEKNIDWILGIDKETVVPRLSEIGGNFHQVRDSYADHLMHYNTYFPLLLLDCFSKISAALKGVKEKEKTNRNICKVGNFENRHGYVSVMCESFIDQSDVENIPKDGHIILAKFSTVPTGNVKILGYVCSSATRAYSHKHDHGHDILRFLNTSKRSDLLKIKITFFIAFALSGINLEAPVQVTKLINIKKALNLNNALGELKGSPLCDSVLSPWNHKIKSIDLPRRQDTSGMTTVVQDIVQTLDSSSPRLTIVKSAPFTDSFLAIVQIVEEMQKFLIPGKVLVCVRSEVLNQMGLNLIETSCNVVIINREKENIHGRLQSRILDVMASHYVKALDIPEERAKYRVLQETDVLLAVTGSCYYEDVKCLVKDLTYCIIHDAHSFTEPESLLPLLYGIRHLFLFGDPDEPCHVSSKGAASWGYNKSLFHRVYNLC